MNADVLRMRASCMKDLNELPEPVASLARAFYQRRVERVAPKPLLGEYLPWMLRAMAGLPRSSEVDAASRAWLLLYLHVLAIDDLVDVAPSQNSTLPIVSSVLLRAAIAGYSVLFPASSPFWRDFDELYFETAVAGAREVLETRGRLPTVDPGAIDRLSEKLALVRLCHGSLLRAAGRGEPSERELAALRNFGRSVQLFDDVSDWEDDFSSGNFTPLLALAISRSGLGLPFSAIRSQPPEEMLLHLVETGAMEECLHESTVGFREALEPGPTHHAGDFVGALIDTTEWLRQRAGHVRRLAVTERQRLAEPTSLAAFKRSKRLQAAVADFRTEIQVVAQSS